MHAIPYFLSVPCELRPLLPVDLGGNAERLHERLDLPGPPEALGERHRFAVALGLRGRNGARQYDCNDQWDETLNALV